MFSRSKMRVCLRYMNVGHLMGAPTVGECQHCSQKHVGLLFGFNNAVGLQIEFTIWPVFFSSVVACVLSFSSVEISVLGFATFGWLVMVLREFSMLASVVDCNGVPRHGCVDSIMKVSFAVTIMGSATGFV